MNEKKSIRLPLRAAMAYMQSEDADKDYAKKHRGQELDPVKQKLLAGQYKIEKSENNAKGAPA